MNSSDQIKRFILDNLTKHQKDIVKTTIRKFGLSRPAILKHMNVLISTGRIDVQGTTRDRTYKLLPLVDYVQTFAIKHEISIDKLIHNEFLPQLEILPKNVIEICEFGITAILNNVIDHAKGKVFTIKFLVVGQNIQIHIMDDGVGIFRNICEKLNLNELHLSALELSKGKMTTDPDYHAGEDISVVMHLFDRVQMTANGVNLVYDNSNCGWKLERWNMEPGTTVALQVNSQTKRSCAYIIKNLFKDESVVRIPVVLGRTNNEKFISRGQAESLIHNISNVDKIEFDFKGVDIIGPAFANELIRKIKRENNSIDICWINSNDTVDVMMSHVSKRFS